MKAFGAFWWDFVLGEDPKIAIGVVSSIAVTALLAALNLTAWWLMPVSIPLILALSLRRSLRGGK